ncbi:hypothetical protein [Mycolicibacterium sp. YH-1]|uniref:hypothetical protein n=1 Tax=Mycolicibacterium sp. YH-1 TaxID=2908837 RepID=UPI001F4BF0A9|nr:hypothetical protein [Mycolicibacterium sp. YH-1]UNB52965.1 hypothetical protein L0M16_00825 [Mycolicibacterium sp. YH-1]
MRFLHGLVTSGNVSPGCGQYAVAAAVHTALGEGDIRALPGFVPRERGGVAATPIQLLGEEPGPGERE